LTIKSAGNADPVFAADLVRVHTVLPTRKPIALRAAVITMLRSTFGSVARHTRPRHPLWYGPQPRTNRSQTRCQFGRKSRSETAASRSPWEELARCITGGASHPAPKTSSNTAPLGGAEKTPRSEQADRPSPILTRVGVDLSPSVPWGAEIPGWAAVVVSTLPNTPTRGRRGDEAVRLQGFW
jgi:hypothetical protein